MARIPIAVRGNRMWKLRVRSEEKGVRTKVVRSEG
jgi:hypothetical protein